MGGFWSDFERADLDDASIDFDQNGIVLKLVLLSVGVSSFVVFGRVVVEIWSYTEMTRLGVESCSGWIFDWLVNQAHNYQQIVAVQCASTA